ncbi:MAG TPA: hypothetical protein VLZ29_07435 [Sulfurimonas sp.]|uniref:hypothetical protein n=1 Tax=Sulfurimonas sp. TaxID=2022749 RepID=UPI002C9E72AC|nr:hypothetical protein [Sulfurimonas sp.]HUH42931.1 hypothetical protein [Sulfurimonas sp.]
MSSTKIIIKHNKHRIHPCPNDKKLSLLTLLLEQNSMLNILVASSQDIELTKEITEAKNVTVVNDDELVNQPDLMCDLLISYDLPSADIYMSRLSRAKEGAIILLDISEQQNLYPIETILKRVIRQDIIVGYEYEPQEKMKIAQKSLQKEKSVYKFDPDASDKPSYEKTQTEYKKSFDKPKFDKPKWDKPKRDGDSSERKPFDKPKFDKPKYDKPKYDKPKRDGENSERKPFDKPKWDKPKSDGESSERKPFDKPKWDKPKYDGEKKYDKSGKKPNKFLGKDDSGKAKFSGKSGERNHKYDGKPRENIEAPKNVGRKITIKERKPKDEPNS